MPPLCCHCPSVHGEMMASCHSSCLPKSTGLAGALAVCSTVPVQRIEAMCGDKGAADSTPTPLQHASVLVLTGSCSWHCCFHMPPWKFLLAWSSSWVSRWDYVFPPPLIAPYPSGPAAEGMFAIPEEGRYPLTATLAASLAPNYPSSVVTRQWRPSPMRTCARSP